MLFGQKKHWVGVLHLEGKQRVTSIWNGEDRGRIYTNYEIVGVSNSTRVSTSHLQLIGKLGTSNEEKLIAVTRPLEKTNSAQLFTADGMELAMAFAGNCALRVVVTTCSAGIAYLDFGNRQRFAVWISKLLSALSDYTRQHFSHFLAYLCSFHYFWRHQLLSYPNLLHYPSAGQAQSSEIVQSGFDVSVYRMGHCLPGHRFHFHNRTLQILFRRKPRSHVLRPIHGNSIP